MKNGKKQSWLYSCIGQIYPEVKGQWLQLRHVWFLKNPVQIISKFYRPTMNCASCSTRSMTKHPKLRLDDVYRRPVTLRDKVVTRVSVPKIICFTKSVLVVFFKMYLLTVGIGAPGIHCETKEQARKMKKKISYQNHHLKNIPALGTQKFHKTKTCSSVFR